MAVMMDNKVEWTTAEPLMGSLLEAERLQHIRKPVLLRFKSDAFMQELISLLQTNPDQLSGLIARPESFRAPPTGESDDWQAPPTEMLKLYQPTHGFFYLVAASLVCHAPGLPDRTVNTSKKEKVAFVLRRLSPDGAEMAWVSDPNKEPAQSKSWLALAPDSSGDFTMLASNEELLPMYPLNFTENGRKRRLLTGLIPTSSRETFQAAQGQSLSPSDSDPDLLAEQVKKKPLLGDAETKVIEPLDNMVNAQQMTDARVLEASQFILLDCALFLSEHLPTLWAALADPSLPAAPPDDTAALYTLFKTSMADTALGVTWQVALLQAWASRSLFADGGPPVLPYNLQHTTILGTGPTKSSQALDDAFRIALVGPDLASLPSGVAASSAGSTGIPTMPKLDPALDVRYVLRCVYQRPNCGPLQPDVVSDATEPFSIASFFDSDAPTRSIRITLPIDTSIAGLRKFRKNVGFLFSNKLREQMESVKGLKETMDGQINQGQQFDLGMICSFSIPIITICALFVLMIFLILLNIIFWWLPFIRICFPIKLKSS
jgi:hypothetical protein